MTYRVYNVQTGEYDTEVIFDESHVDDDNKKKPPFDIGDTVAIIDENHKYAGVPAVVVKSFYGNYVIEPYNTPYVNNPRHLTKLGPFGDKHLVKVKKPKDATTAYTEEPVAAINPISIEELQELSKKKVPVRKRGSSGSAAVEPSGDNKLKDMFSGGSGGLLAGVKKSEDKPAPKAKASTKKASSESKSKLKPKKRGNKMKALMLSEVRKLTEHQLEQVKSIVEHRGDSDVSRNDLIQLGEELFGRKFALTWVRKFGYQNRVGRGRYSLRAMLEQHEQAVQAEQSNIQEG